MANFELHEEFTETHKRIALGDRALVAIAAHTEVRSVLRASDDLRAHGLDDVLIGSYARRVSTWPGKDVDVFGRLSFESVDSLVPDDAYAMFGRALKAFDDEGRLTPQPHSFKVDYREGRRPASSFLKMAAEDYGWSAKRLARVERNLDELAFEFSVDVVPAVPWGKHYGIPETTLDPATGLRQRTGSWCQTNPVALTEATRTLNGTLAVGSVGAYIRMVRSVKQVKAHHLAGAKPSSLYYEFALHDEFAKDNVEGNSWADITASTLTRLAVRLRAVGDDPICDPVLGEPYAPVPAASDLAQASALFEELAARAGRAVDDTRCQAAIGWRSVFGGNDRWDDVFPLPRGCRGTGTAMGAGAANLSTGGTEEKSFGGG